MVTEYAPPSIDPASRGDLAGTFRFILTKFLQDMDDMLPARVLSYDRQSNRASVQAMINVVTTRGDRVKRGQVFSVPVLQLGGGGFVLSFPINSGDLGWLKANDRDISLFMQSFKDSDPNTQRKHSFSDAMFIPDTMFKSVVIDPDDEESVVLQSVDGTQRVAISEDRVTVTSDNEVVIDAPLTRIKGNLVAGENTGGAGTATFSGSVLVNGDVIGDADGATISLNTHTHNGVQPGSGNTGQPNP